MNTKPITRRCIDCNAVLKNNAVGVNRFDSYSYESIPLATRWD